MSTRAGSATASLRAKQNLVRLLFQPTNSSTSSSSCTVTETFGGRFTSLSSSSSSSSMDATAAAYSYCDLRTAYLQKVQELHPDKSYYHKHRPSLSTSKTESTDSNSSSHSNAPLQKSLFQQVQEAWKLYESYAKSSNECFAASWNKNKSSGNATATTSTEQPAFDANFTMFGVGCSFADNEQERQYRNFIMDQASRGYFTTGEISCNDVVTTCRSNNTSSFIENQYHRSFTTNTTNQICNDDLFDVSTTGTSSSHNEKQQRRASSSLVSHLIPPHRRRPQHHHNTTWNKTA